MAKVFLTVVNGALSASYVVLAVLLLRLLLKKAPKWIRCFLWCAVGLRMCLPFSLESKLSLIPSTQVLPPDLATATSPHIHSGIPVVDKAVNPAVAEQISQFGTPDRLLLALAVLWIGGVICVWVYGICTSLQLRKTVKASICYRDNIYYCDDIDTAFIFGFIKPRIYLPSGIDPAQMEAVIAHENAHLKRKDHWWKPLGYLFLSVYWFNPLLWLAYILLCRDIELACDEKVIQNMDKDDKKAYSQALVAHSCHRKTVMACPLAFGEVSIKTRIKAVLHYKKPGFWILIAAGLGLSVLVVCFLTNPKPCQHQYTDAITKAATCANAGIKTFTCQNCAHSYTEKIPTLPHTYNEGNVLLAPSCTEEGQKEFCCMDCPDIRVEIMAKLPHRFASVSVTKEPNCTETGAKTGICLDCEQEAVAEVLPVNGQHVITQEFIVEPTCTKGGEVINTCSLCGFKEQVTVEKLDHNYVTQSDTPGTCSRAGLRRVRCSRCKVEQILSTGYNRNNHMWTNIGGRNICIGCGRSQSVRTISSCTYSTTFENLPHWYHLPPATIPYKKEDA